LEVGNIDSEKDWGYAQEYVEGMYLSLQANSPEDYIFATGQKTKVRNFIDSSFGVIDISLKWEGEAEEAKAYDSKTGELLVQINPKFYRPIEIKSACGNPAKAKDKLNWSPSIDYKMISEIMVSRDIENLSHA
jgi:GDPmannose 4,6-dehydratase